MTDTPLHAHPAVVWLLASEFCPKRRGIDGDDCPLVWRELCGWTWGYTSSRPCIEDLTTSLTLAAVEALWAWRFGATVRVLPVQKEHNTVQNRGWPFPGFVCFVDPDPAKISSCRRWSEPVEVAAPTKLLATLAAVEEVCMTKEESK